VIYQSDRDFQLWDYTVSHAQLLLRSPATTAEPFNIDIVFLGVKELDLPTSMRGLTMTGPEPLLDAGRSPRDRYRLTSGGKEYAIVAAAFRIYKNHLDLKESSLEFSSREEKAPGEILTHSGLHRGSPEVAGQASA
jgi:hypothetical protein